MIHRICSLLLLLVVLQPEFGLAISLGDAQSASDGGPGSSLALAAQNLTSGHMNIACVKWEASVNLSTITDTAGNTYTLLTQQNHSSSEPRVRCGYVLSATGNASNVVTFTFSGSASYMRGAVHSFSYTGGSAVLDGEIGSTEDDSDLTPSSNTLTTTGTDEVCLAIHGDYTSQSFSSTTINGVAHSGSPIDLGDTIIWYRLLSATFSSGASSLTRNIDNRWVQRMQCVKVGTAVASSSNLMLLLVGP